MYLLVGEERGKASEGKWGRQEGEEGGKGVRERGEGKNEMQGVTKGKIPGWRREIEEWMGRGKIRKKKGRPGWKRQERRAAGEEEEKRGTDKKKKRKKVHFCYYFYCCYH